jgi:hypothetical protein
LLVTRQGRLTVFRKTKGHCHFCGGALVFKQYGHATKPHMRGAWELDHVIQKTKGGASSPENYLPACGECNHLRWHRSGNELREVILLGLIAKDEKQRGTALGDRIAELMAKRLEQNKKRRQNRARKIHGR